MVHEIIVSVIGFVKIYVFDCCSLIELLFADTLLKFIHYMWNFGIALIKV